MKYLILLLLPFFVACEKNFDIVKFTLTPEPIDSAKFRMDGCYFSNPLYHSASVKDSSSSYYVGIVFYENGTCAKIPVGTTSPKEMVERVNSITDRGDLYEAWGVFSVDNDLIMCEKQLQDGGGNMDWLLLQSELRVINDSTLNTLQAVYSKEPDKNLIIVNEYYYFVESDIKPDSTLFPF